MLHEFPNILNISKLPLPWHFSDCMMVAMETHGVEGSSLQSPSRNHRRFLKGKNVILYISRWTFRSHRLQRDTCGQNTNTNKNHKPGNIVPPRGADCNSLPMRNSALNSFVFLFVYCNASPSIMMMLMTTTSKSLHWIALEAFVSALHFEIKMWTC